MFTKDELIYYSRQLSLPGHGLEVQKKLRDSRVLVVGVGGLGCPAAQYLAAAGIGKIGLVDDDIIRLHNLHRQILFGHEELNQPKAEVAYRKLRSLNPFIQIVPLNFRLEQRNCFATMNAYDLVIDCTDNYETRYMLNDACVLLHKPFISGALFRTQSQVGVFNLPDENGKRGPTYRCLHPAPPENAAGQNCAEAGIMGVIAGMTALTMTNEALKIISGRGKSLSGKILISDYAVQSQELFAMERNETAVQSGPQTEREFLEMDYGKFCHAEQMSN